MNKTILFVDDDADDRDILAHVLKDVGPNVNAVFAENGLQAIDILTENKQAAQLPCLIVLDLNMPYLNGKETFKKIKNELRLDSIPIVIFTSSQNPDDEQLFKKLGIEFITKPSDFLYFGKVVSHMVQLCSGE